VGAVCSEIIVLVISGLRVIEWYASFFSRNWPYWSGGRRRSLKTEDGGRTRCKKRTRQPLSDGTFIIDQRRYSTV